MTRKMQASHENHPQKNDSISTYEAEPRPHRVLIVDDEPTLRFGFGIALSTEGFEITEADDGDAAIRAITQADAAHGFDAMLLDLRMPGKGGIDVLRELSNQGIFVPTVIVSAHIDSPTAVEAIEWGAVDFLQKPTTPDDLRGVVSDLIAEESGLLESDETIPFIEQGMADAIVRVRWYLRRRRWGDASELLDKIDSDESPVDDSCWHLLCLWRMIVSHLRQREQLGGKTEFASSRFYEASDLLKYIAYNSE